MSWRQNETMRKLDTQNREVSIRRMQRHGPKQSLCRQDKTMLARQLDYKTLSF